MTILVPPKKVPCAECGAETAFVDLHDPELQQHLLCDQCNCLYAGCCGVCGHECQGLAWPDRKVPPKPLFVRLGDGEPPPDRNDH